MDPEILKLVEFQFSMKRGKLLSPPVQPSMPLAVRLWLDEEAPAITATLTSVGAETERLLHKVEMLLSSSSWDLTQEADMKVTASATIIAGLTPFGLFPVEGS